MCLCVGVHTDECRYVQKTEVLDHLELEIEAVTGYFIRMLEIELRSSEKASLALSINSVMFSFLHLTSVRVDHAECSHSLLLSIDE